MSYCSCCLYVVLNVDLYLPLSPCGIKVTSLEVSATQKHTSLMFLSLSAFRLPEGQTGQLRRGLLPGRYPPDRRRSRAVSDTLGGGQAQEERERGGPQQGAGRHPEDDRA